MTRSILAACLAALCCSALAAPPACRIQEAVYTLRENPSFTAGVKELMNGEPPVLYVHSAQTQHTYWFRLTLGNGHSDTLLTPIVDPAGGGAVTPTAKASILPAMALFELDDELQVSSLPAEGLKAAPRYLFIPELGHNLFYFSQAFSNAAPTVREELPRSLFVLARCKRQ